MLIVQRRRLLLYPSYVQDYLDRVTAADVAAGNTQGLELGVTDAFNTTLQNLVGDSVLGVSGGVIAQPASTIKAMPFMVGARTLQGCFVPVVGAAPTNVSGLFNPNDYNRKTGLKGDGAARQLLLNRANNADPQSNKHIACWQTESETRDAVRASMGSGAGASDSALLTTPTARFFRINSGAAGDTSLSAFVAGLWGASVFEPTSLDRRYGGVSSNIDRNTVTPSANDFRMFTRTGSGEFSDGRYAFYSIGEAINLALLDARVTALINAIAAAIP
jgi:hypothetical protein